MVTKKNSNNCGTLDGIWLFQIRQMGQQQVKRMLQEHVAEQLVLCTNLRPFTYLDKPNGLEGSAEKQILKRVTGTWIKSCQVVGVPFRLVLVGGFSL